jgi:hypothetical protein
MSSFLAWVLGKTLWLPLVLPPHWVWSIQVKIFHSKAAGGWAPFESSSIELKGSCIFHWVKKADVQTSDYPYAKFNMKLNELGVRVTR